MSCTPITPDDWTDTVETKCAEAFVEPVFIDPATLAPGTAVEIEWPTTRDRFLYYADEGGYQITAGKVGNGDPYPWKDGRIVRVFTEDKPTQEPVLPRPIDPEDVRVGMVVERRHGDMAHRDRVQRIGADSIDGTVAYLWWPGHEEGGWTLWLVEDEPEPVDPDAAAVEAIVTACRRSPECSTHAEFAEAMLDHLRDQGFDVTPRAEQ